MFIHPNTQREHAGAFDAAVSALRYGSININCPTTTAFSVTALPWGAFPGEDNSHKKPRRAMLYFFQDAA
jgi:hypothetical protein